MQIDKMFSKVVKMFSVTFFTALIASLIFGYVTDSQINEANREVLERISNLLEVIQKAKKDEDLFLSRLLRRTGFMPKVPEFVTPQPDRVPPGLRLTQLRKNLDVLTAMETWFAEYKSGIDQSVFKDLFETVADYKPEEAKIPLNAYYLIIPFEAFLILFTLMTGITAGVLTYPLLDIWGSKVETESRQTDGGPTVEAPKSNEESTDCTEIPEVKTQGEQKDEATVMDLTLEDDAANCEDIDLPPVEEPVNKVKRGRPVKNKFIIKIKKSATSLVSDDLINEFNSKCGVQIPPSRDYVFIDGSKDDADVIYHEICSAIQRLASEK